MQFNHNSEVDRYCRVVVFSGRGSISNQGIEAEGPGHMLLRYEGFLKRYRLQHVGRSTTKIRRDATQVGGAVGGK